MPVYYPIATYLETYGDTDAPSTPKPALQQYDNYQIYSLICCDYPSDRTYLRKSRVAVVLSEYSSPNYFTYTITRNFDNTQPFTFLDSGAAGSAIAYQQFSARPVLIDFSFIANKLNIKLKDSFSYRHRISTTQIGSYKDKLSNSSPTAIDLNTLYDIHPNADSFGINPYNYIQKKFESFGNRLTENVTYKRSFAILQDVAVDVALDPPRLNMFAAVAGYSGDPRIVPKAYPQIVPSKSGHLSISYYRKNPSEPIPNVTSLDWYTYDLWLNKGESVALPLIEPVFGTLVFNGDSSLISNIKSQLAVAVTGTYQWSDYYAENIDSIVTEWTTIYNSFPISSPAPSGLEVFGFDYRIFKVPIQRVLSANNNHWNNDSKSYDDVNADLTHPLFRVNNKRAHDWHILEQTDGSYGNLIMNSPKLEDIWTALNAGKWAVNPDDPTKPRVDNLGWRIERGNQVLGIRVKTDGTIDAALEKTVNRRIHADSSEANDVQDYNPNCFAKEGLLVRHVPNKFNDKETIEGGYRKVKDIPQLLAELHEQANAAMGYQEGTAIEIQLDGEKYRYPNQLALLTELFVTTKQIATYAKGSFFSSLISEQSIKEVMSGLGLRTVDKYLEFIVAQKPVRLYYKGISASQSIRRKLSAVATNVGTVLGNLI